MNAFTAAHFQDADAARELIESIRDRGVTIVLVTHSMEEAERLADRLAVIDQGRVVALDTPAALVSRVDAEQRMNFKPSVPLDDALLTDLPEVTGVTRSGDKVIVSGKVAFAFSRRNVDVNIDSPGDTDTDPELDNAVLTTLNLQLSDVFIGFDGTGFHLTNGRLDHQGLHSRGDDAFRIMT